MGGEPEPVDAPGGGEESAGEGFRSTEDVSEGSGGSTHLKARSHCQAAAH